MNIQQLFCFFGECANMFLMSAIVSILFLVGTSWTQITEICHTYWTVTPIFDISKQGFIESLYLWYKYYFSLKILSKNVNDRRISLSHSLYVFENEVPIIWKHQSWELSITCILKKMDKKIYIFFSNSWLIMWTSTPIVKILNMKDLLMWKIWISQTEPPIPNSKFDCSYLLNHLFSSKSTIVSRNQHEKRNTPIFHDLGFL